MTSLRTFLRTPSNSTASHDYPIPSSPSFGDFHEAFKAEHAGVDRESVLTASSFGSGLHRHSCDGSLSSSTASSSMASSPKAFLQRFSFDSTAFKPPLGYDTASRPPLHSSSMPIPRHTDCALRATTSADYYVEPVPSAPASQPAAVPSRRRKEGKIDGLDYWGFCELLRSSSL